MSNGKRIITVPQDLKAMIEKALINGKWFITVSYKTPGDKNDLKHWWKTDDYPTLELENALEHIKRDVAAKHVGDGQKEKENNKNAAVKW